MVLVLTPRLPHFPAPRRYSSIVRTSSGSGSLREAAAFAPGLTMRELKASRVSAAVWHQDDDSQAVQEKNESETENKITLYKEKRNMILFAILASASAGCFLIVFMFLLVAAQRFSPSQS